MVGGLGVPFIGFRSSYPNCYAYEDDIGCGGADYEQQNADKQWEQLPKQLQSAIIRLFDIKLTGSDVRSKVAVSLGLSPSVSDRMLLESLAEFLNTHVGKTPRVNDILNSEWRNVPGQTRTILANLLGLPRGGTGVTLTRQIIAKFDLTNPDTDIYELTRRIFRQTDGNIPTPTPTPVSGP